MTTISSWIKVKNYSSIVFMNGQLVTWKSLRSESLKVHLKSRPLCLNLSSIVIRTSGLVNYNFSQSLTVPKILNNTKTDTFFQSQIFPIRVLRLFSDTNFYQYRFPDFFRYHIFPILVPIPPKFLKKSVLVPVRYRYLSGTSPHHKSSES